MPPNHPRLLYDDHLTPFGTHLPVIDPTKTLRVILQNPQHSFQIYGQNFALQQTIENIKRFQAQMYVPVSPNINWCNLSHSATTKRIFRQAFGPTHLSATSSDIGYDHEYIQRPSLVGGAAIITFGLWASKVSRSFSDSSGNGIYTVTTIQGKQSRKVSFISAYISVKKGSDIGIDSVYAQQITLYERTSRQVKSKIQTKFCPRIQSIKYLEQLIHHLQQQNHAIVLMLDANQTSSECFTKQSIKPYTIEWLKVTRGLIDPFTHLVGSRPNSTTIHPNRDIDWVLMSGIDPTAISTLEMNTPAHSDHLGIAFDINMESTLSSSFSELAPTVPRILTSGNKKSVNSYLEFVYKQLKQHKIHERTESLYHEATHNPDSFSILHMDRLDKLDRQFTEILLAGERQCSKKRPECLPWSPHLQLIGRTLSYWKQKYSMVVSKKISWSHLDKLRMALSISEHAHYSICLDFIRTQLLAARKEWKHTKQHSVSLRAQFLQDRATSLAHKMHTSEEKALRSIRNAERSKRIFRSIKEITHPGRSSLTQVEVLSNPDGPSPNYHVLSEKYDIESAILERNQRHSFQSLSTPFATHPTLSVAIDPSSVDNNLDQLIDGDFVDAHIDHLQLSQSELEWIRELKRVVPDDIQMSLSLEDFKSFFKTKQENTASSPSGRHMGHYKVMLDELREGRTELADIVTMIAQIPLMTSCPLQRWQQASQVMLEKGKGQFVENLRIIQLVEADLNFVLHVFWGKRLIRHALAHDALDTSQFALPGQTCINAVWNKLLFLDLSRQTLSPGIMTDYDAKAAFDRVLSGLSIITCQRLGLPRVAGTFMFHLLRGMQFHLITGFGKSTASFKNNDKFPLVGQGVLQGSSSAAPIYTLNSDVSLTVYRKLGTGAAFTHPVSGDTSHDVAVQFVDDKTQFLNELGAELDPSSLLTSRIQKLFIEANKNTQLWSDLLWISGGTLNVSKCFYYAFRPTFHFGQMKTVLHPLQASSVIKLRDPLTHNSTELEALSPTVARRTLGVILAPSASCSCQLALLKTKALHFRDKIMKSSLSNQAKWIAIQSILDPGISYPLPATYFSKVDIAPVDTIMSQLRCNALGLNRNFPRAVLHGPTFLGGMGLPTMQQKTTAVRVNYFLFNMRNQSAITDKLDMSVVHTQIELGLFDNFFSQPFTRYGHLVSQTLGTQIWRETEPWGLTLQPAEGVTWLPLAQGYYDKSIMDLATTCYNARGSHMINRCRLFLRVISVYDLLSYNLSVIHPSYIQGERAPSRIPSIQWVDHPCPPKHFWKLWSHFLHFHVTRFINDYPLNWNTFASPNYSVIFFLHHANFLLYCYRDGEMAEFVLLQQRRHSAHRIYTNVPYISETTRNDPGLYPVDVYYSRRGIHVLGPSNIHTHGPPALRRPRTLTDAFKQLPIALQRVCGSVTFPDDGGTQLLAQLSSARHIYGASDASLKGSSASQAWIISPGSPSDIENPNNCIHGMGPVDGDSTNLSSTRGELQGQLSLLITSKIIAQLISSSLRFTLTSDNDGVVHKCSNPLRTNLRHHRDPNMDLLLQIHEVKKDISATHEWVRSHQDKEDWEMVSDLVTQKLSRDAIYNVWCDRQADTARTVCSQTSSNPDVLPAERWALYSQHPHPHKITGHFNRAIQSTLAYEDMLEYLKTKHGLDSSLLDSIFLDGLQSYLSRLHPHKRATAVKFLHNWHPTNAFLYKQQRITSPRCSRCQLYSESADHVISCQAERALSTRRELLYSFLNKLPSINTPIHIIVVLEYKLSLALNIPFCQSFSLASHPSNADHHAFLLTTVRHQNRIGWGLFMKGFVSKRWLTVYEMFAPAGKISSASWLRKLVVSLIQLHLSIWADRNEDIHGKDRVDQRNKARQRVIDRVTALYNHPPRLSSRFKPVRAIPLQDRMRLSTQALEKWLSRVQHQIKTSQYLDTQSTAHQPSIPQLFAQIRSASTESSKFKYPP